MQEFVTAHKITMTAERTDSNPHMDNSREMDHWRVTLRRGSKRMSLVFSKGFGHNGAKPTAAEVLDCLASDASSVDGNNFEDWARELGYDEDSRKAQRTYNTIERQLRSLGRLLGPDLYPTALYDIERM